MDNKKIVIISAINFFEGGPLSVLKSCLDFLDKSIFLTEYRFIALVHKKDLFNHDEYNNIEFIEFPKSRTSYFYRLYYEYIYFKNFATKKKVFFWLSLHDITPSLKDMPQAVYCHNPSPFNEINIRDIYIQPTQFFFRLFYKYIYRINIKNNKFVIVQQLWIKEKFIQMFDLKRESVILAPPKIPDMLTENLESRNEKNTDIKIFFFPTFPRPFKNIEIICEAVELILAKNYKNFKVILTIDGSENKYSRFVFGKYRHNDNIEFVGLLKKDDVYKYYSQSDCLIFPSKLETWGLPISEYKQFNKPILVSDLPYAKETVGDYNLASFFNPDDAYQLAELMISELQEVPVYDITKATKYQDPIARDWNELFEILLDNNYKLKESI